MSFIIMCAYGFGSQAIYTRRLRSCAYFHICWVSPLEITTICTPIYQALLATANLLKSLFFSINPDSTRSLLWYAPFCALCICMQPHTDGRGSMTSIQFQATLQHPASPRPTQRSKLRQGLMSCEPHNTVISMNSGTYTSTTPVQVLQLLLNSRPIKFE